MFVPRFDAVDATDPVACAAFLDLALSLPEVERWKGFSHDVLSVGDGDYVLDIGCGTGADAVALARRVGPRGRVVGIDLSHALVALAQTRAGRLGLPISFRQADINELPFADDSFSRTRIDRVLHFLPDPGRALREAIRVTARGGRIVVTEPDWRTLTVSGGDPGLTAAILDKGRDRTPGAYIGSILPQLLAQAGLALTDCHDSTLELREYGVAAVLFGLEALASHAVAATPVSAKDAAGWLRSLRQASALGTFSCTLSGTIAGGLKPIRTVLPKT